MADRCYRKRSSGNRARGPGFFQQEKRVPILPSNKLCPSGIVHFVLQRLSLEGRSRQAASIRSQERADFLRGYGLLLAKRVIGNKMTIPDGHIP